jgi:hypothetical protein
MAGDVMAISAGKTLTIYLAADLKKFNNGISQAQGGLTGLAGSMKNVLGPAAIGAGIAVAGLATKLAIDGVKAAAEDEVSLAKLTKTLENLKLAHSTEEIDTFIDSLEQSVGYLGDLRPAYDRLIRSTKDSTEANRLLTLSLDVSAGTGKSVEAVAEALGKAYDGNTGALGRLGAGIDKTTIASGNMNEITGVLAETFGGQASAQADTFNGRMQKLQRASEQLTEAFGQGLLRGLEAATGGTDDLVKSMENLEVSLESAGVISGKVITQMVKDTTEFAKVLGFLSDPGATWNYIFEDIAIDLRGLSKEEKEAAREANNLSYAAAITGRTLEQTALDTKAAAGNFAGLSFNINQSTKAYIAYINANSASRGAIQNANKDYMDLAARQKVVNTFTYEYIDDLTDLTPRINGASSAVQKLTKREKELTEIHEATSLSLTKNRADLALYTKELQTATDAIEDFTSGMQANLLAGIDLGAAFTGQFDEAGAATGVSLLEGFNKQIDQAEYFGNVLNAIKAQGADSRLIEQIAGLGPEVGAKLGQQMLDEGLVPELNNRFVHVQDATKELAMKLVPEFLIAGQESALTMVDSISEQMAKEVTRLAKIGKRIAKPLGQSFKAELMKDVAAALREVEAAGTAGRVEAVARAESRQVALTNAAVAQALQNLVRSADARNGAPIAPVLS